MADKLPCFYRQNVSSYDAMNRLTTVMDWLSNTTTYNYDPTGNLISAVNPNNTAAAYQYNPANRLVALTNSGPVSTVISSYAYTLDAVGNHSRVDQVEQLQTTPVVGQFSYTYDNDNRMVTSEGQAQGFDANGNMISISSTNLLSYDFENRLTQTIFAGTMNSYQYDGTGNRMAANRAGVVTRYVLDRNSPLTQVLAETDSGGNIVAYYIYGLGLISRIDFSGNARYYHSDSRGSTVALTDATGQLTDAYAYDPFGIPRFASGNTDNRFRYLGRHGVVDEENGLNYIRARYYSARRGRFITKDPTTGTGGDSQSLNRYVYALNNPVRLVDISGLSARDSQTAFNLAQTSDTDHRYWIERDGYGSADAIGWDLFAVAKEFVLSAGKDAASQIIPLIPGGHLQTLQTSTIGNLSAAADVLRIVSLYRNIGSELGGQGVSFPPHFNHLER